MLRVTGGSGSFDQKILTKISPLIGGMDILDFGRETKKSKNHVLDFLDCGVHLFWNSRWSMGHIKHLFLMPASAFCQVQRVVQRELHHILYRLERHIAKWLTPPTPRHGSHFQYIHCVF